MLNFRSQVCFFYLQVDVRIQQERRQELQLSCDGETERRAGKRRHRHRQRFNANAGQNPQCLNISEGFHRPVRRRLRQLVRSRFNPQTRTQRASGLIRRSELEGEQMEAGRMSEVWFHLTVDIYRWCSKVGCNCRFSSLFELFISTSKHFYRPNVFISDYKSLWSQSRTSQVNAQ